MTNTITDLWEALDRSAIKLLADAMGGELPAEGGGDTIPPAGGSLNERTRVFAAISAYAKSRLIDGPKPEEGTSNFHELRGRFRGSPIGASASPKRGTRGPKKAAAAPGSDGSDA